MSVAALSPEAELIAWHELEYGTYAADLPIWERLAGDVRGPILELGCGSGRVALHLARRGHEVCGVDIEAALISRLEARARERRLPIATLVADATALRLGRRFPLVLAPMQLVQVVGDAGARAALLEAAADHLAPNGRIALSLAVVGRAPQARRTPRAAGAPVEQPLPDVREHEGWVFASFPPSARRRGGRLELERVRKLVSPDGVLSEAVERTLLELLSPSELEAEASRVGLRPGGRREVPATAAYGGSTVVVLEAHDG